MVRLARRPVRGCRGHRASVRGHRLVRRARRFAPCFIFSARFVETRRARAGSKTEEGPGAAPRAHSHRRWRAALCLLASVLGGAVTLTLASLVVDATDAGRSRGARMRPLAPTGVGGPKPRAPRGWCRCCGPATAWPRARAASIARESSTSAPASTRPVCDVASPASCVPSPAGVRCRSAALRPRPRCGGTTTSSTTSTNVSERCTRCRARWTRGEVLELTTDAAPRVCDARAEIVLKLRAEPKVSGCGGFWKCIPLQSGLIVIGPRRCAAGVLVLI